MQLRKDNAVYNTDNEVLIKQLENDGFEEFEYKEREKEPSKSKKEPKNKEGE
ncbi:hypothetical protein AAC503_002895 [Listeria monocytogenes]|uniref:hypothetical protein n=1 Tax=Listeria monocytogenes TaxID=1639 RepID=UPI0000F53A73|nr:hypothetical protein [Listeria monocytogenes]AGR15710.1 hypothetical protein M643_07585 [Listeria monocytogenes]EFK40094.1 conserved hypothetical protein [Listeria monocytogenes FSL N1-017]EHJ4888994.1 hypothetical protein [Listeria monocytogenes]EHL9065065.1 hypothetical protein [Listeria monocytogenes]EHL9119308.1 hypothetical protein [Listeria monocytogenes]